MRRAIDVGPQFSGTVSAIMNPCGNLGGAISPLAFGDLPRGPDPGKSRFATTARG
ncbi:MAG: hypothetical protein ACYTA3_01840 [Planctomycetota bacterium]|jgi:hypothetical protein